MIHTVVVFIVGFGFFFWCLIVRRVYFVGKVMRAYACGMTCHGGSEARTCECAGPSNCPYTREQQTEMRRRLPMRTELRQLRRKGVIIVDDEQSLKDAVTQIVKKSR